MGERIVFQHMMLEQVDIHMQKIEVGLLTQIIYKN